MNFLGLQSRESTELLRFTIGIEYNFQHRRQFILSNRMHLSKSNMCKLHVNVLGWTIFLEHFQGFTFDIQNYAR